MTKDEKMIVKILSQLQDDVNRLKRCVGYNGYSGIVPDLTGAELSLNHAMNKMTR